MVRRKRVSPARASTRVVKEKSAMSLLAKAVVVDGPFPKEGRDGDEVPVWTVSLVDDDGDDLKTYECSYLSTALSLGRTVSKERRLELVVEAANA